MNQEKYIGMDVHQATISVAVMDSSGKLIMECILETKAATILEFIAGLRGTLSGKAGKVPTHWPCGVRCRGGMTLIRAFVRNLRTGSVMRREKAQVDDPRGRKY